MAGCGGTVHTPPPEARQAQPPPTPWAAPEGAVPPPAGPTTFVRTRDSRDWVTRTIRVQSTYERVIAVTAGPPPATVRVPVLDLESGRPGELVELRVAQTVPTLQAAANAADGGDLVAVLPGTYAGFTIGSKRSAGDGRYIHFRALGAPGQVTIDRPSPENREWMVYLLGAHHVVVQGFHLSGAPDGPRAGIMIDGDFGRTGRMAHHVVVADNYAHHHRRWGIHATDTRSVLMQDNLFAHSAEEHSAYVSDGSDDWVIRRNVFFRSHASGLQINLDPVACFEEVRRHPAMASYPAGPPTREWAVALLAEATRKFGEHGFPDGRGTNFIVEQNVVFGHGKAGGGAFNLASVSDSLIQNNLLYGNAASGITQWDDGNPYDNATVRPGPRTAAEVGPPESRALFGCRNNLVRNNTVLVNKQGRPALQAVRGSFGTRAFNNVLVNEASPSIEIDATGIPGFEAGHNVLNTIEYDSVDESLRALAKSLPEGGRSVTAVTRARFAAEVVRYSEEPWVVLEGGWWKLNPARPDFRPRKGSPLLAGRGDPAEMPPVDLLGAPRRAPDVGALAP